MDSLKKCGSFELCGSCPLMPEHTSDYEPRVLMRGKFATVITINGDRTRNITNTPIPTVLGQQAIEASLTSRQQFYGGPIEQKVRHGWRREVASVCCASLAEPPAAIVPTFSVSPVSPILEITLET